MRILEIFNKSKKDSINSEYCIIKERSELLNESCGVGLWEAVLHEGDAMHAKSIWTWSPEFRRLVGYSTEAEYPNVVQSWSDRLHPDDVAPTFAAFTGHLQDRSGRSRYDVSYRLQMPDRSFRWFRATGGCRYAPDGETVRACGSLTDIHQQKTTELELAAVAEADRLAIVGLTSALASLASGDFTASFDLNAPPKFERIKSDFNLTVAKLRHAMENVAASATAIRLGVTEISTASDDLSRRTEQQAASLEETAAALDQITATVRKTAENTRHARAAVSRTRAGAERSSSVVGQAVKAMTNIEKSSREISQIIGVIDEIAFQTNLLALNAGVEAARAGEAGRGFAVVASEVRALAQRSAEAAKEIKGLISTSGQQVEQGVAFVGQTGEALQAIVLQVTEIDGVVGEIAASAQEQAAGLDQVNTAINQMDQVTQQNAVMVEETTAGSRTLCQEASELNRLIGEFRIESSGGSVIRMQTSAVKATSRVSVSKPVAMLKATGHGGAVVKSESATQGWEEF